MKNQNTKTKNMIVIFIMLLIGIISLGCLDPISAQSAVYVVATSEGGEFNFEGSGDECEWDVHVEGFDLANTDVTNNWGTPSDVRYENIGEGTIFMKVAHKLAGDEFWYFNWLREDIDGNGTYTKGLPGGHSVTVANSTNITGYIDYRERDHKAVFLMDSRHSSADLTVVVHNGHLLENASVELLGGPQAVQWTDEDGVAKFKPSHGTYALLIEATGFNAMLVEDLFFETDKRYHIKVNMTDCLTSSGTSICAPDADDLVMYYRQKDPNMGTISPQGYVDYFADRLRTCMASQDKCAAGSLERMCTNWGVYPTDLDVLLYDCDFTEIDCVSDTCTYDIEYTVMNFQQYKCNYIVSLVCSDVITKIGSGTLNETWSMSGKETKNVTVEIKGDCDQMHLLVMSARVED